MQQGKTVPCDTSFLELAVDPSRAFASGTQAVPPSESTSLAVAAAARFPLPSHADEADAAAELAKRFPEVRVVRAAERRKTNAFLLPSPPPLRLPRRQHNHLRHLLVPKPFVGKRFGDLFVELLLSRSILCIGVYRSPLVHSAPLSYVVTNPSPKMRLHVDDRLYVLVGPSTAAAAEEAGVRRASVS